VRHRTEVNRTARPWTGSFQDGICPDCLRDLRDPQSRRFRYPFIACGQCGPGFTITRRLPYVRENTTMAPFVLCEECRSELEDPGSRFYRSATLCCPECGPNYWIEPAPPPGMGRDVLEETAQLLRGGRILVVKDLCSFRVLCRAQDEALVRRLRRRKQYGDHPLSVLVRDADMAATLVQLEDRTAQVLCSPAAPLLALPRRESATLAPSIAPGFRELPAPPLEILLGHGGQLLHGFPVALVEDVVDEQDGKDGGHPGQIALLLKGLQEPAQHAAAVEGEPGADEALEGMV